MKSFTEIFFSDYTHAVGWTLLHSLWQSLIVLVITFGCLRVMSATRSGARYIIACSGFFLMIAVSVLTFIYQNGEALKTANHQVAPSAVAQSHAHFSRIQPAGASGPLSMLAAMLEPLIPIVVVLWLVGLTYYSVRLFNGLMFTYTIRTTSVPVNNEWDQFLRNTGRKLGIKRVISLAESASISSPIVIGYLKPVVLIPVGMFSGLTTEELETIFLHELAHVKRNDYLVNIIQTVFETIFFFNPFVKVLSNEIRKEREYCCDDLVVHHHAGTRAYAHALARLAEARLTGTGFALALGGDKNELLKRIKRIMEKSARHESGRNRIVIPAMIFLGGLLCISWLGSGRENVRHDLQVRADSIPDKNMQGARYSRRSIITIDENGQPHEELVEEFEGDESLRAFMEEHIPPIPQLNVIPPGEPLPVHPMTPAGPTDTIPPAPFGFENQHGWEELSRSMQEMQKRFEELQGHMNGDSALFPMLPGPALFPDWNSFAFPDEALRSLNEQLGQLHNLDLNHFRELNREFGFHGDRMDSYEKILREELVKDGYLEEGEAIESLEWNNETFKVNGRQIKESLQKKYKDLNDKFFAEPHEPGKVE